MRGSTRRMAWFSVAHLTVRRPSDGLRSGLDLRPSLVCSGSGPDDKALCRAGCADGPVCASRSVDSDRQPIIEYPAFGRMGILCATRIGERPMARKMGACPGCGSIQTAARSASDGPLRQRVSQCHQRAGVARAPGRTSSRVRARTASAACRSLRCSRNWKSLIRASRHGARAGCPGSGRTFGSPHPGPLPPFRIPIAA